MASICQLRLFNFQASWNAILEAEKLNQDSCSLFGNTVYIHKFRITLELVNGFDLDSGHSEQTGTSLWSTKLESIITFAENPEEHVLILRKISLKSHDHDDLTVLLLYVADYFRSNKTTEHYQSCNESKNLLMSIEDNYLKFINSSQIYIFFQAKLHKIWPISKQQK